MSANLPIENWLWGGAVASLAATITLSGVLPQEAKTIGLGGATLASFALVGIESLGADWKKYRRAQNEILHSKLEAQYGDIAAQNEVFSEMQYKIALVDLIKQKAPIEAWEALFNEHELSQYALPDIYAAREAMGLNPPPMIELEAEVLPRPELQQESIVDQVAREIADNLDVEWFTDWKKRSGIVCGESKDGKSFLLTNIVLAGFIKEYLSPQGKLEASIYICDPDYGSAHEGEEPNTWLGLPLYDATKGVGENQNAAIAITIPDICATIRGVSMLVDRRAEETALRVSKGLPKLEYPPVLLIVDEEPMVVASLEKDDLSEIIRSLVNILNRGLKQNIRFKMGSQTLAVGGEGRGGTRLPMDMLRKVETVILWRAAQVRDNYENLGVRLEDLHTVLKQLKPLPQMVIDSKGNKKFVCATFLEKDLRIKAIPEVKAVKIADRPTPTATPPADRPLIRTYADLAAILSQNLPNPYSDEQLIAQYEKTLTQPFPRKDKTETIAALREAIDQLRS